MFIEFSKKCFSKFVRSNFPPFCKGVAVFEGIDLQVGMIFLIQVFLCFEIYTSSLRKKLSRATRGAQRGCGWANFFFVTNFPEATFHLPGERELLHIKIYRRSLSPNDVHLNLKTIVILALLVCSVTPPSWRDFNNHVHNYYLRWGRDVLTYRDEINNHQDAMV